MGRKIARYAALAACGAVVLSSWRHAPAAGQVAWAFGALAASFFVLMQSADALVGGAVGIARALSVPKIIVGIVLVSLTTTAPELVVSVKAALRGEPQFALGNAVGSVICDDGLALALMALVAAAPIAIHRRTLRSAGIFLVAVDVLAFVLAFDARFTRIEGGVLVALFVLYLVWTVLAEMRHARRGEPVEVEPVPGTAGPEPPPLSLAAALGLFAVGVAGVLLSSSVVLDAATAIAFTFEVPEVIIGLTLIAFGTSLPEIATCIAAGRKGEGAVAVGDILGADILNICWILGLSAVVNPIEVKPREIRFMFPAMLAIVVTMLVSMRIGHRVTRAKGVLLLVLFAIYLVLTVAFFGPPAIALD